MNGTTKNHETLITVMDMAIGFSFSYFHMEMGRGDQTGHGIVSAKQGHDIRQEIMKDTDLGKRLAGN